MSGVYRADPGEQFASDTHRRVMGHLTTPEDDYGWTIPALVNRMVPDGATQIESEDEMQAILDELEGDGLVETFSEEDGTVYRMTQDGVDLLTGGIKNEPPPTAEAEGPAIISMEAASLGATTITTNGSG